MGVDWIRMRLETADTELVRQLVEAQALAVRQGDRWAKGWDSVDPDRLLNPDRLDTEQGREDAMRRYVEISNRLEDVLTIETEMIETETGIIPNYSRVYPILHNCLFPSEWRIADERTILPDELPDYYARWVNHFRAVEAGKYRGYLFEWYLYTESLKAQQFWVAFRWLVEKRMERDNAWVKRIRLTDIPARIMALPEPPVFPIPRWSDWEHDPVLLSPEGDPRYIALSQAKDDMNSLTKAWNSRAAQNAKYGPDLPYETFNEFLHVDNSWTHEFLVWVADCIDRKYGLYLDG